MSSRGLINKTKFASAIEGAYFGELYFGGGLSFSSLRYKNTVNHSGVNHTLIIFYVVPLYSKGLQSLTLIQEILFIISAGI